MTKPKHATILGADQWIPTGGRGGGGYVFFKACSANVTTVCLTTHVKKVSTCSSGRKTCFVLGIKKIVCGEIKKNINPWKSTGPPLTIDSLKSTWRHIERIVNRGLCRPPTPNHVFYVCMCSKQSYDFLLIFHPRKIRSNLHLK